VAVGRVHTPDTAKARKWFVPDAYSSRPTAFWAPAREIAEPAD
jgi:hypothetical protein